MALREIAPLLETGEKNAHAVASALERLQGNRAENVGGTMTAALLGVIAMTLIGIVPILADIADALDKIEERTPAD